MTTQIGRNGPALWETLLEALDYPGAVIAGGCIRDYLLGLEPKDIDIFVPAPTRAHLETLLERLNDSPVWGLNLIEIGSEGDYTEGMAFHEPSEAPLIGVLEGEALGLPVNIISRTSQWSDDFEDGADNWSLINSFDFGILQWSFQSTTTGIVATTQALMDLAARTATLTTNRCYQQSIARFERFAARNPGALRLVDNYGAA